MSGGRRFAQSHEATSHWFSACAGIIVILFVPEFQAGGFLMALLSLGLIVVYFYLTWNAAQERE